MLVSSEGKELLNLLNILYQLFLKLVNFRLLKTKIQHINYAKLRFNYLVSVHKVPFAVLRSSENYTFTMSKLRIFGLCKPCNRHFLNRHTYCKNFFRVYRQALPINKLQVINEPGLKSIFIAKLCVDLNFCILINNGLTPVQKFKTP
ncbi:MAG: hypothetical protein PWQ06_1511 [Anaerophaga sp.]|nr:hypothetical protein [Anaerophaga sp.]